MSTRDPMLPPGGPLLAVAPSGPDAGGGGGGTRRAGRRALWGVGALATSPDTWEGPARRRLVRAATVTGVMGLAWASTTTPAVSTRPAPRDDADVVDEATPGDDAVALVSPFERWHPEPSEDGPAEPARPAPVRGSTSPAPAPGRAPDAPRSADPTEDRQEVRARQREQRQQRERRRATARRRQRDQAEADRRREERRARRAQQAQERREQAERDAAAADAAANAWRRHPLASHEEVVIVQPSPDVRLVGFHEAAIPGARSLGLAAAPDAHHGRDWVPHGAEPDALLTMVLPSRGRGTHSTTAIDVAVPAGRTVHAPVTGVVTTVEPYLLYGQYPDTRLVIRPDARPDLRLVVLHVTGHAVAVGDHVEAGVTPIAASATPFPFESQVDRFTRGATGSATPHVHLELRPG